jgi:hypothetical protein
VRPLRPYLGADAQKDHADDLSEVQESVLESTPQGARRERPGVMDESWIRLWETPQFECYLRECSGGLLVVVSSGGLIRTSELYARAIAPDLLGYVLQRAEAIRERYAARNKGAWWDAPEH